MRKTTWTMMTVLFAAAIIMSAGCGSGGDDAGETPAVKTEAAKTKSAVKPAKSDDHGGISFKVDGELYSAEDYFATHFPENNLTGFVGGKKDGWSFSFEFEGKGPGNYKASGNLMYETLRSWATDDLTVTITSFGNVRGYIEGTFSGTVTSISDETDKKVITDGKFRAWRTPWD